MKYNHKPTTSWTWAMVAVMILTQLSNLENDFFSNQPRYARKIAKSKLVNTNHRIKEWVARNNKYMYKTSKIQTI